MGGSRLLCVYICTHAIWRSVTGVGEGSSVSMDKGRKTLPSENVEIKKSLFLRLGKEKKF